MFYLYLCTEQIYDLLLIIAKYSYELWVFRYERCNEVFKFMTKFYSKLLTQLQKIPAKLRPHHSQ